MRTKLSRRKFLQTSALATVAASGAPDIWIKNSNLTAAAATGDTIDVGVLFSRTGSLTVPELSMSDSTLMAIKEINDAGGVAGRMINPITEDCASDMKVYNQKAQKLVTEDKTVTTFGSFTTASRLSVLPVYQDNGNLLFYPTFYEGSECSQNVVYTGSVPNQQLYNMVSFMVNSLEKWNVFIVGSDYEFPRAMAKIAGKLVEDGFGEVAGDEYVPLGGTDFAEIVAKIKASGADSVISNVIGGDSVKAFYAEFQKQGLLQADVPICATSTSEIEVAGMGPELAAGSYSSFPYFQAIDTPENAAFIQRWRDYTGDANAVTHHPMESCYFQVHLWKQAAETVLGAGEDLTPMAIREASRGQEFKAPGGTVQLHPENLHTFFIPRVAQWDADGQGQVMVEGYYSTPLPYAIDGETESNLTCTAAG
ncbi:transporter substrate-binding protein [Halovulum sp. GXIMD14793]